MQHFLTNGFFGQTLQLTCARAREINSYFLFKFHHFCKQNFLMVNRLGFHVRLVWSIKPLHMKAMINESKKTGKRDALKEAYEAVKKLGYTHKRLGKENLGVIDNTLRNVRDGKPMKGCTVDFYLDLFVSILDKESQKCFKQADTDGGRKIYKTMRKILLLEHGIPLEYGGGVKMRGHSYTNYFPRFTFSLPLRHQIE